MKLSRNSLVGITLIIAFALATFRLGRLVAIREVECLLEKPFETHFATGTPLPTIQAIEEEIRECEKVLVGFDVPLKSTRFREDISRVDSDPGLYFGDQKVQQLCRAINANKLDELNRLISNGVNVNAQGAGGITPLIWAFAQNKPEVLKLLLKNNADPDLRLSDRIHLHGAYSSIGDNFFTLLASFYWIPRQLYRDAIPYSKNIDQRNSNGDSLLMIFARQSNIAYGFDKITCEALVAAGVDLNAQNDLGDTVCTLSSSEPEKCLWFIEHGANPSLRRHDGNELLDLLKPQLERIEGLKTDKASRLNQESPAAIADRLGQEQQLLRLRDRILEYKRTVESTEKKPDNKAEKVNEN